jgi:hypothetical protein
MIANISLSYMFYNNLGPLNFLLSKAIGCLFCMRTTPNPSPDVSHSNMNGWEKYGKVRTRQVLMTFFILSKVSCASSLHLNAPFLVKSVNGANSCEKPLTNLL